MSAPHGPAADAPPGWRERLLGGRDRLGWWLLPLFVMVGLGGAVLAGSLAVVYYAQQVSQLESETREAREELVGAADEVRDAADEALAAIDEEAAAVREELARGLPLADALEVGVVRLEVDTTLEATQEQVSVGPASSAGALAAPTPGEDPDAGGPDEDGGQQPAEQDDASDAASDEDGEGGEGAIEDPTQEPPSPQTREVPLRRSGSGFVVVADGGSVFIATSLGLLDDPRTEDRVPADVEVTVRLSAGTTTGAVHSWDEDHDLVLLEATIGNVEPLTWREQDAAVDPGDRLVAVGATPDLAPVRVGTEVAGVSGRALVTALPALDLVDGGPVVDLDGAVVGIAVASHAPLGGDPVVVPVRRLCDQLLSTCPD